MRVTGDEAVPAAYSTAESFSKLSSMKVVPWMRAKRLLKAAEIQKLVHGCRVRRFALAHDQDFGWRGEWVLTDGR